MTDTDGNVKRRTFFGSALMSMIHRMREMLMLVVASDYLMKGLGQQSPIGVSYLHVIEEFHIWIAVAAYAAVGTTIGQCIWFNLAYVRALLRRLVRTYKTAMS